MTCQLLHRLKESESPCLAWRVLEPQPSGKLFGAILLDLLATLQNEGVAGLLGSTSLAQKWGSSPGNPSNFIREYTWLMGKAMIVATIGPVAWAFGAPKLARVAQGIDEITIEAAASWADALCLKSN